MGFKKLLRDELLAWVDGLVSSGNVHGVQKKGEKFDYAELESAEALRLDYDTAISSPKKYFLPATEPLASFKGSEFESSVEGTPTVLLGVHPYDAAAIAQMDKIFCSDNTDVHYCTRRKATTIVAVDPEASGENCFAGQVGFASIDSGYDVLLTKIGDAYLAEAATEKGEALLSSAGGTEATDADRAARTEVQTANVEKLSKHKLNMSVEELPYLMEASYDNPIWAENAKKCFSCGSCNLVCPTCYCFDVQDDVEWNLEDGERTRCWDGCMLSNFALCAGDHNFRGEAADRYRHRYYRKAKYVPSKIGEISCVGCGRCVSACVAKIANPPEIFNALHATIGDVSGNAEIKTDAAMADHTCTCEGKESIYVPESATVTKMTKMTEMETFFEITLDSGKSLGHKPGQFVEISVAGYGEAPISISSSPTDAATFDLVVRKAGVLTGALHNLNVGDKVGIRGPFGTDFPVTGAMKGKDILFIAGGIGLVPLRSAINFCLENRADFGRIVILSGTRTAADRLFTDELAAITARDDVELIETVDVTCDGWDGCEGVVTKHFGNVELEVENAVALICGPPIMYKFCIMGLKDMGITAEATYVSLERHMKCGVGKCGHCQINGLYACQDGPVFKYSDVEDVREAL